MPWLHYSDQTGTRVRGHAYPMQKTHCYSVHYKVPLKVGDFFWLVTSRTILIWDNARRRNWHWPSVCHVYGKWGIHRPFISRMHLFRSGLGLVEGKLVVAHRSLALIWRCCLVISFSKHEKVIWDMSAAAAFWEIWWERNNRIFNNKARSSVHIFSACFTFIYYCVNLLSGGSSGITLRSVQHI